MTTRAPPGEALPSSAPLSSPASPVAPATYRLGALEVMAADLGTLTWDEAVAASRAVGPGWRLPTLEELRRLYEHRAEIGGFSLVDEPYYWSSEHHGVVLSDHSDDGSRWYLTFDHGEAYTSLHTGAVRARAVRDAA